MTYTPDKEKALEQLEAAAMMTGGPDYEALLEFYNSCACLFAEGVEFMTKEQIYEAIKKDWMKVNPYCEER